MTDEEADPPKPFLVRARKREGRCYELAFKGILQAGAERFLLVHGTGLGREGQRIGHAWLLDRWLDAAEYAELVEAVESRRYTAREAAHAALAEDHSGPWAD